jgi:hypothetical protein
MRASLCFTPEQDELLSKGWPRFARFVDGHPHDKSAARHALAWLGASKGLKYDVEWPREVAHRALRLGPLFKMKTGTVPQTKLTREDIATAEKAGPPSIDEVRAKIVGHVASEPGSSAMSDKARAWFFLAEALIGTDVTLEAIADGLATIQSPKPRDEHAPPRATDGASVVGFLLLRAKNRKAHVARFKEELKRFRALEKKNELWDGCAAHLDCSLNGAAGVKRWLAGRMYTSFAEYAHDDPDYVLETVASAPEAPMTVRLVAIAGTAAMKDITKRRWMAAELPSVIRDFGMIRAPETVELVLSLVGKSTAKDAPIRWLEEHADYARPIVERAAKRGNAMAKRVMPRL